MYMYIVYLAVNRRMDEWVTVERVGVERGPVEETPKDTELMLESLNGRERKVTRNLKRKHDEINHVQKVHVHNYTYICMYMYMYINVLQVASSPGSPSFCTII